MVEGSRLSERYLILERIAVGGMGGVYLARDEKLNREVTVKVLKEDLAEDPLFVERFRREARAVAALSHPNVATVYDYGEDDGHRFIVMEYIEGRDLARLLREEGPLDPERVARIGAGIARALDHAHSAGVIHRDVKPANAIVSAGDRVKVTDFGIARAVGESTLTATGSVMGTAQYISPEQAAGDPVGPHSDIYALGIVLYEMLTGAVPFSGDKAIAVAMRHVSDDVPAPSATNPEVPPVMDAIVARATHKDPAARYPGAAAMADELDAAAVALESGGDTATMELEEDTGTVWPIPGSRYDPERLGRRVITALVVLAVIALALLAWRLVTADPGKRIRESVRARAAALSATDSPTEAPPSSESSAPPGFVLGNYVGSSFKDVEEELKDAGMVVDREDVDSAAEKDSIIAQDPGPETELEEGATVTLTVSTGKAPEEDSDEDDEGPPGLKDKVPPGHEKKDKD